MSEIYFTARELSDLQLENFPKTEQGINRKAIEEGWSYIKRKGRGGGRLYPISVFAPEVRLEILTKRTGPAAPVGAYNIALEDQDKQKPSLQLRGDARAIIAMRFKQFAEHHKLSLKQAEALFIDQYAAEKSTGQYQWFADWICDLVPAISVRSLHRWRADQKLPGDMSLKYGNRKGLSVLALAENGAVKEYIAGALMVKPHLKPGHIRDLCRSKFGETLSVYHERSASMRSVAMPGIRAFERHLIAWKKENASIFLKVSDPDAWKNKHMVALGSASAHVHRLNQQWEIDASPADVLLEDGRYSIYAIIDVWSRRSMFSVSRTACTDSSLLLIRRAILEWGVPETIKTDNGSDFVSRRFMTALKHIGIEQKTCQPFTPEGKPHVERVIKTMQHDLMELLPGYVGHSVKDRKQIEARKAFAQRLGETDKNAFAVSMTHETLQTYMNRWANEKYAHKAHGGLKGETPFQKAASWTNPVMKIDNERALDILLAPLAGTDGWRVIGKKGLRIDKGIFYGDTLELHVGERVFVRHDPEDMGRVYVFNEDQEFICVAKNDDRLGVDPSRAAAEAKSRQKKMVAEGTKELRRAAKQITPEKIAEDVLSVAAQSSASLTQFPVRTETHTSAPLNEAARAFEAPVAQLTPQQQAAHEALIANFQAPKRPEDDPKARWEERLTRLEGLEETEFELETEDREWLDFVRTTPWYQSRMLLQGMRRNDP